MERTKSRALISVALAVMMGMAFMPSLTYTSFAAAARMATKIIKTTHRTSAPVTELVGTTCKLTYKLSPSKLTSAARKVVWKTSNKKVVKLSNIKSGSAVATFMGTGSAKVTVKSKLNSKVKVTWKFNVLPQEAQQLTGVTVTNDDSTQDVKNSVQVGDKLHAEVTPADATATYQWYLDGAAIDGATAPDYNAAREDVGKALSVKVTGTGAFEGTVSFGPTAAVTDPDAGTATVTTVTIVTTPPTTAGGKELPPICIENVTLIQDYKKKDCLTYPSNAAAAARASLFPVYRVGDELTVTTSLSAEDCDITWVLVKPKVNENLAESNSEVVETLGTGSSFTIPDNDENLVIGETSDESGTYRYYVQAVAIGKGEYQRSRSESAELTYYSDDNLPGENYQY